MQTILNSSLSEKIDDYIELRNYSVTFTPEECEEFLENHQIMNDYKEMRKVFFTQEANVFGHNYAEALIGPKMGKEEAIKDIVKILNKSETSRKAILTFSPYGDEKVPCINVIHFLLRNNVLEITYFSRGQDIFRKFPCDAMCIIEYGNYVANKLGVVVSKITAIINSAHIYEKNIVDAREKIRDNFKRKVILTSNSKKYADYNEILRKNNIMLLVSECDIPEIQAIDSIDIVRNKAKSAYERFGYPIWVDDVELKLEAYERFPGAYTKSVFKQIGIDGMKSLLNDKSPNATIICRICSYDGISYKVVEGHNVGVLDFGKSISDEKMPLNSIFIGEGTMVHRERAINKLINL